jgi:glycerate dehydrogenase
MNIVITDGYTLNPGDLDWKPFYDVGSVQYYDRTRPEQVKDRCRDAEVIVTNKTPVDEETIRNASKLKLIAVTATGYNVVDVEAARKRNVVVCNVPEYGTASVAQHTISLLLELSNKVGLHSSSVRAGEWQKSIDWCYSKAPLIELSNKTLGIVGMGKIGRQTARIAKALGMKIIFYRGDADEIEARKMSLKEVFASSDFVSLHCPLRDDNYAFVNSDLLATMKPSAYLINTSRGQLIQEHHLADALNRYKIAGAALDVLSMEPPPPDHPLIHASNCIITPHNAWVSVEARQRILATTLENIKALLAGYPQNTI